MRGYLVFGPVLESNRLVESVYDDVWWLTKGKEKKWNFNLEIPTCFGSLSGITFVSSG